MAEVGVDPATPAGNRSLSRSRVPGQGGLAVRLASRFDYTGYEPDGESFRVAQRRLGGRGMVINDFLPAEPDEVFDVVGAFEVLEHIEGDREALEAWRRWLTPGGQLMLSVPSHQDRFGPADLVVGHYRRYERDDLQGCCARWGSKR